MHAVVVHAIIEPATAKQRKRKNSLARIVLVVGMDDNMETASTTDPLLQPGFRFYPTEEELLTFYLRHRLAGTRPDVERFIPVVDLYSYHPRDLQPLAGAANVGDAEQWFFFCPRAAREAHGGRPARTTPSGYWKATGSPSWVFSSSFDHRVIGERRTMVFYTGRAPAGVKTRWKMNEYKAVDVADDHAAPVPLRDIRLRNEFSVCRVYISIGTVRSFDRRPLNLNLHAGGHHHDQFPVLHHQQQLQRQQQQLVPLPRPAVNTSNNNQLAAIVPTTTENSHFHDDDDRSSPALRGTVVTNNNDWDDSQLLIPPDDDGSSSFINADDGADNDWDWSQLIIPPDNGFGFNADGFALPFRPKFDS